MKTNREQARRLLLSFFAVLMPFLANAQIEHVEIDGIWYNLVSKAKVAEVTSNPDGKTEYAGDITIPSMVTYESIEYDVTRIVSKAFYVCRSLTSITIPEGVTSIEFGTFSGCSSLTSITIPESVTSIGQDAFSHCSSLTSITLPESVTNIGRNAFYGCSSLTSINFSESVTDIGASAFEDCSSLTSITIPKGVTSIGNSAFEDCSSLTSITLPESVTRIESRTFYGCSSLTSITISKGVTSIETSAFSHCSSLTSITIPESVMIIGPGSFSGCSKLKSVVLPQSLKEISSKAFANCPELTDVYCSAEEVPTTDADVFDGSYPEYATLHVPASALESYQSTTPWSSFGKIVAITEDQPAEEEWSEWTTLGTAVTASGKDAMMTNLRYWGEGAIEEWAEPITIDQRTDKADPSKHQLRLNGIFNAKEIILDYDSSTATITAGQQSTGYATNTAMIEEQGVPDPYDEFLFSIKSGSYRPVTGLIDLSGAFFYISDMFGFNLGFTLQIEGVTPPTFTCTWDRKYVGREGGEATLTVSFEAPIVKYRKLVLAPGESVSSSAVKALYAANPETDLVYEETDRPTTTVTCTEMGTYRVVLIPIGADGTAVLDYGITSLVSYAEPDYGTYEWEYLGESTVIEHVGSLLIPNGEQWEEVDGTWVNKYPWQSTVEGVQTYRRADNPNIIGLRNLYGDSHPYSSMFTYIDRTQDWWVYIDITDPKDVRLLTTPVGVSSSQAGYGCFINQYATPEAAIYADGVITFPNGSVLLGNVMNQDFETAFDFRVILPTEEEPNNAVTGITLNYTSLILAVGEPFRLEANVTPDNADDTSITWSSSDTSVATVDTWGKVTAVAPGRTLIFAKANGGNDVWAQCEVTVLGRYNITYLVDGEVYYTETMIEGASIVLPEIPVKEGYTFSGWGEVPETMPAHDVVVEGEFIINKYLVTFKIGDDVVAADSLEYGTTIVAPEAPEKEGHTFNGWGDVAETVPADDVIYEGTYTVNIYKVYYYVGEELVHTAEVVYGEPIPEYIYEPAEEGYTFLGWIGETYATMPAHDVTYTANIDNGIGTLTIDYSQLNIYDLTGRKVADTENLKGGIYIVNGRKVFR